MHSVEDASSTRIQKHLYTKKAYGCLFDALYRDVISLPVCDQCVAGLKGDQGDQGEG